MLLTNNDMLELCEVSRRLELTDEETSTIETIRDCHLNRIELTDNQYDAFLMFLFSLKQSVKFKLQGK